ncbi:MAG: heavy metal translocating P-type ATPase metal-binding domain-containing protein [Saprospiraceae bacterium]|nr:heavy metal translocating P-type ATPase metal-binding domain-containing protein [Saprospiraceae bacterium]MCF8251221.1 heavy metal translocating P-type ATPase metal-binding domain-containing protein [Saprospiraceae bacterium]MCF8281205.1 heavy metal translocating P-type ATPase metal-binding domain-containing protein [Bacteroidales bacterium]MCF8313155.1 heavy metal translocating P-type ATPase metal-binding domain-containing protein [Saprospiraceae bacterium]MCF8441583.1 heavy metal transloca
MTVTANMEELKPLAAAKATCFHCGDECRDERIFFSEKNFCCEGCKTVYEILNASDLTDFYNIEKNAGLSLKGRKTEQYAWLDDPDAAEKVLTFKDEKQSKLTLHLPQIHCASCIWLLENLHKLSPAIFSTKVNFLKREATITFDHETTSLRKVAELLASIGYPPDLNLNTLEGTARKPVSRRLIYQLGVAGFAFGNIMLLSFPEYLGLQESEQWMRQLFGWLNLVLATPVAFYCGRDYLDSAWATLRTRQLSIDVPLALGILVLYFRSAFEIATSSGAGYMDSLAGLVFFLLVGKWFQQMTYHRISFDRDYKSYFPVAATRLVRQFDSGQLAVEDVEAGNDCPLPTGELQTESVSVNKLEPGDRILLRNGELVPADGILKKGFAKLDYSFVTGEAEPVERHSGEKIYAGGRHLGDSIELLLTKKVSQSYLTQLWNDDAFHQEKLMGTSRLANQVSRYFTVIILAVAFGTLAYWLPLDTRTAFNAFTAVLIIACPCAAALNVPFTLGNTVRILARHGFYLKNTNVVEALRKVTAVVFDKTGTLTESGGSSNLEYVGEQLSGEEMAWVKSLAGNSSHPISRQIAVGSWQLAVGSQGLGTSTEVIDFQEHTGKGIEGKFGENHLRIGSASFVAADKNAPSDATVFIEISGVTKGGWVLRNHYRSAAWPVVDYFKSWGKTFLLSGDNERERDYLSPKFAQQPNTPITQYPNNSITQYPNNSITQFPNNSIHFNQSPQDKLNFIKSQQSEGDTVLMLGDGLNDAGALRQADVGIVVAEDVNNFTPACDAVLDAKKFAQLPDFLNFAKQSINLVYAAWILAALYNVVGLSYAMTGNLSPVVAAILMPLSSLTIVGFGMASTTLMGKVKLHDAPIVNPKS